MTPAETPTETDAVKAEDTPVAKQAPRDFGYVDGDDGCGCAVCSQERAEGWPNG